MTSYPRFSLALLLCALALLLLPGAASAAYPIAKDGKIYACFKTKGKGKGAIRVIRNAKVRCPRKWRKMAWNATVRPGPQGPVGAAGASGGTGVAGAPGTAGNVVVESLEDKVSELLTRVETLEGVLNGVTNLDLLNAIDAVPAVGALCEQAADLTDQTTALGTTLGSLNTVLDTLLLGFSPIEVPAALPSFSCPN